MSFIGAAAAMLGTTGAVGIGTTMLAGAMMGGATTIGMNVIRGNDPFDNIGQGLLMGGIGGGIFGAARSAAGEGAINAGGLDGVLGDSASAYNANMGVNSGNAVVNTIANTANPIAGMPSDKFGFDNPLATSQTFSPDSPYWNQTASGTPAPSDAPPVQAGQIANPDYHLTGRESSVGFRETGGRLVGTDPKTNWLTNPATPANNYNANVENYFNPSANTVGNPLKLNAMSPSSGAASASTTSPDFKTDPFGYLTHKDNRLQAAGVALGGLKLAGAFNPRTGLNNLPPRTYQRVNTSYNPGTVNPNYGQPGQPYFVGQGYGPQTRETFSVAAGGGIRALNGGGETAPYVPMTARGQMSWREDVPTDPNKSAAFGRYREFDTNKKEEKGQAEIDANVSSWLERYAKADVKGMAEGGLSNLPAAYQQPQYQMSDFANSPLFQPTGGNAPVQPGISEYIANLNQRSYAPPAPVAAPVVANTTSPTIYDPATQTYSTNPNLPVPVVEDSQDGSFGYHGDNSEKAGGPIASKRYAMGGLAALPEYAAGGKLLSGDGDGMSDSIPAVINGERPQRAALADGEFVIPADVVSHLGNGSTKAGGKRLYEMMANIRKARTGNSKQGKQINPMKFIPA